MKYFFFFALLFLQTGVCFWPFIQMFNFGVVQPKYRPLVVGCGSFVWSMFLCFMKEDVRRHIFIFI